MTAAADLYDQLGLADYGFDGIDPPDQISVTTVDFYVLRVLRQRNGVGVPWDVRDPHGHVVVEGSAASTIDAAWKSACAAYLALTAPAAEKVDGSLGVRIAVELVKAGVASGPLDAQQIVDLVDVIVDLVDEHRP